MRPCTTTTTPRRLIAALLAALLLAGTAPAGAATEPPVPGQPAPGTQPGAREGTPPRLALVQGDVSFWRPGAEDWAPAQVNTPLAPGDRLYTGRSGSLEIQIGPRAFLRAWGDTQVGLQNLEPDFVQFTVVSGHASLDVRALEPGHTLELGTPGAALTVERPGYYRVDVGRERTAVITRRGGRATLILASGESVAVTPSEQVVVEGADPPRVATYVAPELDDWDRWNYARTDRLLESLSARYVPAGVYGAHDLDHHGTWRVVPTYGAVWVPRAVPAGWAPYSAGSWIWDPYFGWTWIDTAPWGWAPFHYGRWVFLDSLWAWAPGPLVVRPVYAPALVVFFGGGFTVLRVRGPLFGWVALGWGEPLLPWWGPVGFVGVPWWAGWGGPRIVNNVVIQHTTVINVQKIVYRNAGIPRSIVAVERERFGRGRVQPVSVAAGDASGLEPVRGKLSVEPHAQSLVPDPRPARRPPDRDGRPSVVATRPPREASVPADAAKAETGAPAVRVVTPRRPEPPALESRPPFGSSRIERREPPQPPPPPRFERRGSQAAGPPGVAPPPAARSEPPQGERRPSPPPRAVPPPRPERSPVTEPERFPPVAPESMERRPSVPPRAVPPPGAERRSTPDPGTPPAAGPEPPQIERRPAAPPQAATPPAARRPPPGAAPPPAVRPEPPHPSIRQLPGEPANRLYPGRVEMRREPASPDRGRREERGQEPGAGSTPGWPPAGAVGRPRGF